MKKKSNRVYNTVQIRKDFETVDRIAHLMDEKFEILGFRFGLDPLINLIPYGGAFIGFIVSTGLVIIMAKNSVSQKVVIKMFLNVLLDMILGGIPILGNIADFFFKANTRNVALLKEHYYEGTNHGSGIWIILSILFVFLLVAFLIFYLLTKLVLWIFGLIMNLF